MANTTNSSALNINFQYGKVWSFSDLPNNSIALDGAVQGPQVDPTARRFSFDHHGGCVRLVTLSTCQQVWLALKLGLVVDDKTAVYINDLDADTVLSVWLLQKAAQDRGSEILARNDLEILVSNIGDVDSHGPIFPIRPLHFELGPRWEDKTPQSVEMLAGFMSRLDKWYEDGVENPRPAPRPGEGYALKANGGWEWVTTSDDFAPLYNGGYLAAALVTPANEGTLTWVVGKRSDLVPLALGPADASKDRSGDYLPTILGELAKAEASKGIKSQDNWGGGTSIGGSPRLPGGIGSKLSKTEVFEILSRFTIG